MEKLIFFVCPVFIIFIFATHYNVLSNLTSKEIFFAKRSSTHEQRNPLYENEVNGVENFTNGLPPAIRSCEEVGLSLTSSSECKLRGKINSPRRLCFKGYTHDEIYVPRQGEPNLNFNANLTMPSQWCDSCINYHQHKALTYPKNIPDTYLDMMMFILSQHGDSSFQRRQFLRTKILNSTNFPQVNIRHVFVFGKFSTIYSFSLVSVIGPVCPSIEIWWNKNPSQWDAYRPFRWPPLDVSTGGQINEILQFKNVTFFPGTCEDCNQTKLQEEAQLYDDIVVFDFLDTYVNLTIKTIVSLNWVFNAYNTDIFLKLDDDVLLDVTDVHQTVLRQLHYQNNNVGNSILGRCLSDVCVRRNLQHKWGVRREVYSPSKYPKYCIGQTYALTRSAVQLLLSQTHNTPLVHLEDASVGILAKKAGHIRLVNIPNWIFNWNWKVDNPKRYRKYHIIHTFQGEMDKVEELWRNIFLWALGNK